MPDKEAEDDKEMRLVQRENPYPVKADVEAVMQLPTAEVAVVKVVVAVAVA
jgi:hypothetical protein